MCLRFDEKKIIPLMKSLGLLKVKKSGMTFLYTLEFFPEEGKVPFGRARGLQIFLPAEPDKKN